MDLRPFDPENTPVDGLMLLEASAGTGKTYALERMVARLVGRDADPVPIDRILVVTFTNRAAREMRDRIRKLLSNRAADPSRDPAERQRYRAALNGFDRAVISTIHGFCRMVLSTWPFESAAPFRQELAPGGGLEDRETRAWFAGLSRDEVDGRLAAAAYRRAGSVEALVSEVVRGLLGDEVPPGSREEPTEEQSRAFARFLEESKEPDSPLNRAADALFSPDWPKEAMKAVFVAGGGPAKTAPSLEKIRGHLEACRGRRGLAALSEAAFGDPAELGVGSHFAELLRAALAVESEDADPDAGGLAAACRRFCEALEPCIEIRREPGKEIVAPLTDRYLDRAFVELARRSVERRLEAVKNETGSWNYADLIRRVTDAVTAEDSPLRRILRRRFRAAFIDEFQDTDPRQWTLFRTLFADPGSILVLIGDPKQSIYGFRGTGLQSYEAARSMVPEAGRYRLDTNYRSIPPLVDAVNRLFKPVFLGRADGGPPVGFQAVASGKPRDRDLVWDNGAPVVLLGSPSIQDAAAAVVGEIRRILDPRSGARWRDTGGVETAVNPSQIAVLVRSVRQEEDMLQRLGNLGIPAIRVRSRSVFDQPTTAEIREVLEALEEPRSLARWRRVLIGPLFRLPPDLLVRFEEAGRLDLFVERGEDWRRLVHEGRGVDALEAFFAEASALGSWAVEAGRRDLAEALGTPWPRRILATADGERRWQDWRHLCSLIRDRQARGLLDVRRILDWMDRGRDGGDPEGRDDAIRLESEAPAVRVMTMHTSKGLEFPLVFLLGGFNGKTSRKPAGAYRFDDGGTLVVDHLRRDENFDRSRAYEWEEEKRLYYVAATRAIHRLWIPRPVGEGRIAAVESLLGVGTIGTPESGLPAHERLSIDEALLFRRALEERLHRWASTVDPPLRLQDGEGDAPPLPVLRKAVDLRLAPRPADPPGLRDPATGSYTSLMRTGAAEWSDDDRDIDPEGPSAAAGAMVVDEELPLPGDRGALFGTLVHALLEHCDFPAARDDDESSWLEDPRIEELFSGLAGRHYPPDWYPPRAQALKRLVRGALRAPVPGLGRLCDVPSGRAEVEFQLAVPSSALLEVDQRDIAVDRGFLKGFIDRLLCHRGRWWVIDWKTNLPAAGSGMDGYRPDALKALMDHHHYHFQYELYLLALCRALQGSRGTAVDWDSEIGGAAYLFLRGCRDGDDRGVYKAKPTRERMAALAESMGMGEVFA